MENQIATPTESWKKTFKTLRNIMVAALVTTIATDLMYGEHSLLVIIMYGVLSISVLVTAVHFWNIQYE